MQKNNVIVQQKIRHFCFYFCWIKVIFPSQYPFFHLELSIVTPFLGKFEVLGLPQRGSLHGRGVQCMSFHNEKRVCKRLFLIGSLWLLTGLYVGYRVCGYFLYRYTSIDVLFSWILQIEDPLQGTNSFWNPRKRICSFSRFEPCPSS